MKYHIQEHLWNKDEKVPRGSCYPTVLACLLDLELHDVPYFHLLYFRADEEKANIKRHFEQRFFKGVSVDEYSKLEDKDASKIENYERLMFHALHWTWDNVREYWLASCGYFEDFIARESIEQWVIDNPSIPYIVSGLSPRGVRHVVIYVNGQLVHDPHPSQSGVVETEEEKFSYSYLKKINA